jgi:dihydrofolate reductase
MRGRPPIRKIIVYIATSADGFIARRGGGIDWLDRPRPRGNYGMGAFYRSIDTVIMGRKTWDLGRSLGQTCYPGKQNYVFSRRLRRHNDVEFIRQSPAGFARGLRRRNGKNVWLVGGGQLIAGFLDAGEIDEFIIHVIPVFIGEGIPLMQPRRRTVRLDLLGSKSYPDGVLRLHYVVSRKGS